jgi:hypothetical protein
MTRVLSDTLFSLIKFVKINSALTKYYQLEVRVLNSLKWSFTFLSSIALVAFGFRKQFADTTQIIPSWKGDGEDLTPHGVYSAASLCDAYGVCIVCSAVPLRVQNAAAAEVSYSFETQRALPSQS